MILTACVLMQQDIVKTTASTGASPQTQHATMNRKHKPLCRLDISIYVGDNNSPSLGSSINDEASD